MADVRLTATNPEDSSVVPVACNAKGELKLEEIPDQSFDGNLDGDLTVSGEGSFAGGSFVINSSGIPVSIKSGGSNDWAYEVYNTTSRITTAHISADGSADFASGDFQILSNGALLVGPNTDDSQADNEGTIISIAGATTQLKPTGTTSDRVFLQGYNGAGNNPANRKYAVFADGSANFKGSLSGGNQVDALYGLVAYSNAGDGGAQASVTALNANPSGLVWRGRSNNSTTTSRIFADGSATFAGGKAGFTAEGHLWCTTRRGDTVILDATSNGMGLWEAYTPPTRREELKDAWAEKNVLRPGPEESSQDGTETTQ